MPDLNHEYLVKGAPSVLAKVVKAINHFRSEYVDPERDDYYHPIVKNGDGTLSWTSSEESLMFDLDKELASLTKRNATKIWTYHGETSDDYIEGCLQVLEKGRINDAGYWKADVGFKAAMAAIELEQSASADAALVLLHELEQICKHADRLAAVLADMLLTALERHPSLVANDSIWSRVTAIKAQIAVSDLMSEEASNDDEMDPDRVRRLLANIEAIKLADGLNKPADGACTSTEIRL
jgi:hypothetical protein